jgi:hypothetical protein
MYARLVRFEGAEPSVLERELDEMREQIKGGMSGESGGGGQEGESGGGGQEGGPTREQMETMRKLIKRVLVLADRDQGSSAMVVFTEGEDEIRQLDAMFNEMSPGEGGGQRQSVDIYEVAIDESSG